MDVTTASILSPTTFNNFASSHRRSANSIKRGKNLTAEKPESEEISIISPSTFTDLNPSNRRSANSIKRGNNLATGNKIHAETKPPLVKSNWFKRLLKDDSSWRETIVTGFAELIGTAILVFVGCMGCVGSMSTIPSQLQTALAFGFAVTCVIQIIGHISVAHINPAVTICAVILGHKSLTTAGVYIVAQLLGAILGYGMLKAVTPDGFLNDGTADSSSSFCVTAIHHSLSPTQGLLTETVATGILILLCCATWDPRNSKNTDSTAIKFGLTVATLSMSSGPYTGCSMNPARSFAPALWNNSWAEHWIYWLGPVAGSILVTLAYKTIFWPKKVEEESSPEGSALNSVDVEKPEGFIRVNQN